MNHHEYIRAAIAERLALVGEPGSIWGPWSITDTWAGRQLHQIAETWVRVDVIMDVLIPLFVNPYADWAGTFGPDNASTVPYWTEATLLSHIGASERIYGPGIGEQPQDGYLAQLHAMLEEMRITSRRPTLVDLQTWYGEGETWAEAAAAYTETTETTGDVTVSEAGHRARLSVDAGGADVDISRSAVTYQSNAYVTPCDMTLLLWMLGAGGDLDQGLAYEYSNPDYPDPVENIWYEWGSETNVSTSSYRIGDVDGITLAERAVPAAPGSEDYGWTCVGRSVAWRYDYTNYLTYYQGS